MQIVRVDDPTALPLANPPGANPQVIGINFSGGMSSVVSQLNAALGRTDLQFSNPSGNDLQVVANSADNVTVNSASVTTTATSLTGGSPQLPLFTDAGSPYTGAITGSGSEMTGLAGRITVNSALLNNPANLTVYSNSPPTPAGDTTRSDFLFSQLTSSTFSYSPQTGLGSTTAPFSGTIGDYLQQFLSQQAGAATSATQLQQGQSVVVSTLQQKFNSTSQVNIDSELSNLIGLQNSYAANAHVMSVIQSMMSTLMQIQVVRRSRWRSTVSVSIIRCSARRFRTSTTSLTNLSTQLATGEKSTTYSGMGSNEGFAIAARSQLSNISAFTNTITNVNTIINAANTALQALSNISSTVQNDASATPQDLSSTGQTIGQQNASAEFSSIVGILNTQAGDRYLFSGSAINTPAVADVNSILNGSGTQAGLKQVIAERAQADGTTGLGRLVLSPGRDNPAPRPPTSFSIAEDVAGSPFGLKLNSVSSTLTGATVTGPSGSPSGISVSLGTTNPNPGDQISITFNLPDGTTESVQLTASNTTPAPADSFAIATCPATPDAATTAANLNNALNTAIGTLANTSLVAASAIEAGNDFFDPSSTATGSVATNRAFQPSSGRRLSRCSASADYGCNRLVEPGGPERDCGCDLPRLPERRRHHRQRHDHYVFKQPQPR